MERDCESELSKLNIEQNACIYHFGASVIHGQRSNILRLPSNFFIDRIPYGICYFTQNRIILYVTNPFNNPEPLQYLHLHWLGIFFIPKSPAIDWSNQNILCLKCF